jgi:hypothetical protein
MLLEQQLDKDQVILLPLMEPQPDPQQVWSKLGLVGNEYIQSPPKIPDTTWLVSAFLRVIASAQPSFKLGLLKRQKFTPEKREQRIKDSLAALNARQPTTLTVAQWKEIVEEIEDEE